MRQARLSLKKLVLAAALLNVPLLAYLFLNVHAQNREVVLNFHRKGINLLTGQRNTTTANTTALRGTDNPVSLVKHIKNETYPTDKTAVFENLIDRWRPTDSTANAHYVFSAFLYKIGSAPTIRIIGAMCQSSTKSKIYCELRYRSSHGNESVVTVTGSGKQLPEGSGFK